MKKGHYQHTPNVRQRLKKQFCKRGHDTFVCGRDNRSMCLLCKPTMIKAYAASERGKQVIERYPASEKGKQARRKSAWKSVGILNKEGLPFTQKDYDAALESQEGRCRLCGIGQSQVDRMFAVDHNHKTFAFRGLLCTPCNHGLGLLHDDPKILQSALLYLLGT